MLKVVYDDDGDDYVCDNDKHGDGVHINDKVKNYNGKKLFMKYLLVFVPVSNV